jgi:hypothetical protein
MNDSAPYIFIVSMDVDADKEALFNEVYDTEHIPLLMQVPGVRSVKRYRKMPLTVVLGGERRSPEFSDEPPLQRGVRNRWPRPYSRATPWAKAVDTGRWASEVRPFTHNRRPHTAATPLRQCTPT